MGGQLIKGYSIEGDSLCQTGLSKSWKLYKARHSSTHVSASIFLIEKKQFKKSDRDEGIKQAKKESTNLLRVRHPGVLAVIEPLVEDENVLAYVSERIEGNISLLIKQNRLQEFITSELELKLFLYPFIQTLTFIHDTLKQAHLAISFDSIFITSDGKWKLAGFGHNQQVVSQEPVRFDEKNPDLAFAAPEVALQQSYCKKSDVFSLGLVILRLLEFIKKSYKPVGAIQDKHEYERQMCDIKDLSSHPLITKTDNPGQLLQFLRGLLSWQPSQRWKESELVYSSWMNDSTLMTVKYLDKISNYESKQQLDFLKGLAGVLDDFPSRVVNRLVVPKLIDLLKYNHLIASIVFIVIDLLKKNKIEEQTFKKTVWPNLKAVTQGKQMTAQAIYLLVLNIEVFEKIVSEADISSHLMPLYIKCYDCPPKLKQLALSMLEKISKKVDNQFLKTKIIPKVINLLKDGSIEIRKDALKGLNSIIHLLDNQTITLTVLPGLQAARKAGSDPFVNAIIAHIHKKLAETLPIQVLSTKILPTLIPYLTEPSLNRSDFLQFKSLIIQMIERIERQSSKQFDANAIHSLQSHYSQLDFKFKEADTKAPEAKKGDYNFLSIYLEPKPEANTFSRPENKPAFEVSNSSNVPPSGNASLKFETPTYNFESLSSGFPSSFLSANTEANASSPNKNDEIKVQGSSQPFSTEIFETMNKKQHTTANRPAQQQGGEKLPFTSFQVTKPPSEGYNPPSMTKEQSKKTFVGASGSTEIKKLKGPPGPGSKVDKPKVAPPPQPKQEFTLPKQQEPGAFSLNFDDYNSFDNYKNFGMSLNPPSEKKDPQPFTNSYSFGNNTMFSNAGSSSNPFEEIQGPQANVDNISMGQGLGIMDKPKVSADFYSYFDSESKGTGAGKSSNSFQLI